MDVRRSCCFIVLLGLLSLPAWADDEQKGHPMGSAGFNDLLSKQIQPGTLKTEQQPDGSFLLTNILQTLSAHITQNGVTFDSIGNSKGKGGFGLKLAQWGRDNHLQKVESSQLYKEGDVVFHTHNNGLAEKFSNTGGGIQQDFIIAVKPEGTGSLHLQLEVSKAKVVEKNNGVIIALKSGRQLTYDRLTVTDSAGKNIPAQIKIANKNKIDVIVDDAGAQYPLTIDPTVGNISGLATHLY